MKKRFFYGVLLTILMVTLGFGTSPTLAAASAGQPAALGDDAGGAYVPGQLVVGLAPSVSLGSIATQAAALAQALGVKVLKSDEQGIALLDVGGHRDLQALAMTAKRIKGVRYAEPNYIYKDAPVSHPGTAPAGPVGTQVRSVAPMPAPYPNDPFLSLDAGWKFVGADIVWANTTASKTVCVLDTGVDYTHKDLAGNVTKGPDYVNNDADPMDDNGRGTAVAGIIAALCDNKEGIAGVSNGKVLAVKVIDSAGIGTAYDISLGMRYCADHADIIDVSWTGVDTLTLADAVNYSVVTKDRLVVAAAGDGSASLTPDNAYPAYYAHNVSYAAFNYGVASVAASGYGDADGPIDYHCPSENTNFGTWVDFVAPGFHIYTTTPWDKIFWLNLNDGNHPRYDYLNYSQTPLAAAFVAAAAARTWGYMHTSTAAEIISRLRTTGYTLNTEGPNCWDKSMSAARLVNLARAMDRGAVTLQVDDATLQEGVQGATISVYDTSTLKLAGSGVITPISTIDPLTGQVVLQFVDTVDILNLSTAGTPAPVYFARVSAPNYTASPQNAFVGPPGPFKPDGSFYVEPGAFQTGGAAVLPHKTANFTVIAENIGGGGYLDDPDLDVWLPSTNKYALGTGYNNVSYGDDTIAPYGSLNEFPFARWIYGYQYYATIVILNRASDTAAPYYPGTYVVGLKNFPGVQNLLDQNSVSAFVWKDGLIKARVDKPLTPTCGSTNIWWFPLQINSTASGAATYPTPAVACGTPANSPYYP